MKVFLHVAKYNFLFLVRNWVSKILIFLSLSIVAGGALYINSYFEDNIDVYTINKSNSNISIENLNVLIKELGVKLEEDYSDNADISVNLMENNILIATKKKDIQAATLNNVATGIDYLVNEKSYNINISVPEADNENKLLAFVFTFMLYLFTLLVGNMIITSVSSEKTSKMLELISYKISAIKLIYAKIFALYLYIGLIVVSCVVEIQVMAKFKLIDLDRVIDIFSQNNLSIESILLVFLSLFVGLIVYTQLYIISGALISDSSQLQLAQLPLTLVSLVCYCINVYLITSNNKLDILKNFGRFVPLLFPYNSIISIVQNETVDYNFLLQGLGSCILFIVVINICLNRYILPSKMT